MILKKIVNWLRHTAILVGCATGGVQATFVTVAGSDFSDGAAPFHFAGTNNYYLAYKSNTMIDDVLQDSAAMGLKVVRAWGFINGQSKDGKVTQPSLGVYDESGFERLDYAVWKAKQLGLRLLIPLVNNWDEFGGMSWYVAQTGGGSHDDFYTRATIKTAYQNYVSQLLNRVNTHTGIAYKNEPAVFAWELANEPRCESDATGNTLVTWADTMSGYIKGLDANHLVCVGDEGFSKKTGQSDWTRSGSEGVDWARLTALPHIDFGTVHLYPDNWSKTTDWGTAWITEHLVDGAALGKPVVLEEFGLQAKPARDTVYQTWTGALSSGGGAASLFWILTGVQDDGSGYPDYDGFDVKYPGTTATVLAQHAAVMTALNAPYDPGLPTLAIADAAANQPASGTATATFSVTLSAAATAAVTVNYATSNGSAVSGSDYVAAAGALNFAAGQTTKTIAVTVNSGTLAQGSSKTFSINLSGAAGANLGDAAAVGTIQGTTVVVPPVTTGTSVAFAWTQTWNTGGNAAITITNNGAAAINGWTLEFDWAGVVTSLWAGVITSHSGVHYVVTNVDYTGSIAIGGNVVIGCTADPCAVSAVPTNITFNGTAAGGGTGGGAALAVSTASLPAAGTGVAYSQTLAATGGTTPYTWSLSAGSLPAGLILSSGGVISGTTSATGTASFTVRATDAASATATKALSLTVATLPTLAINDASVTLQAPPPVVANGYLSTSGNQIVDSGGNPVRITGINWFGFETNDKILHGLWQRNYKECLDLIKQLGFNTLRLPYSNAMLRSGATTSSIDANSNPTLQGLTPLQCLDKVVEYCGQIGLRIFLDRHSANAGGYMNEDVWYIPGDAYYTEQRWIDDWVMLATRYANNPTVIGGDLFNEPKKTATWGNSAPATDWNKAAERCGNAIHAANPNWLIIVEGVEKVATDSYWWGGNLMGAASYPVTLTVPNKLVYSMHDYAASVFAQTWFSAPNYPLNLAGVWDTHFGYIYKNNTAPLLLGEFGCKLATTVDQQWMDKLTDYIDGDFDLNGSNDLAAGKKGMSWTYWCFNPDSGDTGGIVDNDWKTVDTVKMGYISASMAPMLGTGTSGPAAQTMTFTVTLSQAAASAVTVNWATVAGTATAGSDFTAASGTLTFAAGETSKTVTVSIPAHTATGSEQFTVQLSGASGATLADASGTGTILPDNSPALAIADGSTTEGNSGTKTLAFTVNLTGAAAGTVTVNYATANGTATAGSDYTAASGTLIFNAGETSKTVNVTILGDTAEEPDETFTVTLSNPTSGVALVKAAATGTITNDDVIVHVSANSPSIYEGDSGTSPLTFTLTLNQAAVAPVSLTVATQNGTALAGSDYQALSQTVSFAAGDTQKTVSVQVIGDQIEEPTESFVLVLSNASAGLVIDSASVTGTIYDNDGSAHGKAPTGSYNYSEVMQKSLWFYSEQRSGVLPAGFRVSWRGNAAVADGADVGRDLSGGWFDAGDHVKFNLPMAASTTLLAWSALEYPAGYNETGQMPYLLDELKFVCDYFLKCHVTDANGDTLEYYGQVGNGDADHGYWGPSETMTMARPSYKVTRTAPGSDLCGETAASLAAASMVFRASNPVYADTLLANARKLYQFADTYRGIYSESIPEAANFYKSWSGYLDELMWGALWLYRATHETAYLTKAQTIFNQVFAGDPASQNYPQLKWTHAWDDKTYGALVMFSELTTDSAYRVQAERWLDYWTVGRDGQRVTYSPGGLAWIDIWGSLRYAANTAFLALVYSDRVRDYSNRYRDFAVSQINYALGSNPAHRSYVCGFGNNPPVKPHHRGAHGSWNNQITNPTDDRHVLYGALVGGPGKDDSYTDTRDNFQTNEVACDYNAGFTGALARLYELYGGYTDPAFPRAETPDPQFFVEASVNSSAANYTEIRALLNNHSAFPARASSALRYRYFVDLTELYAAGGTKDSVTLTTNMLDGGTISGLLPWDAARHLYYVELRYDGVSIIPGGSTSYRREAQFRLTVPTALGASAWNPTNDFSYNGLLAGNSNTLRSVLIPVYENGALLEGTEPTVSGTYGAWREAVFTANQRANAAVSGPNADPDGDGMNSLLEYALGGNPLVAEPGLAPKLTTVGAVMQLEYHRPVTASDLVYQVEWSDSLAEGSWSTAGVTAQTVTESAGMRTVRASVPVAPTRPQRFMRLNILRNN